MKMISVSDFIPLLDKGEMLSLSFLMDLSKTFSIPGDVFFWDMKKDEEQLKKKLRTIAHDRGWNLRHLTTLYRHDYFLKQKGYFCITFEVSTPKKLAILCNRLYKMKAFL